MNSYIDYNYYNNTYKGELIPQEDFNKISIKASSELDLRIGKKDISNYENEVKYTTCLIADIIYNQNSIKNKLNSYALGEDKIISSEKVGDYSRNISNFSVNDLNNICSNENIKKIIDNEIETNLYFTGLFYRGMNVQ